jgi:hypothetical protein
MTLGALANALSRVLQAKMPAPKKSNEESITINGECYTVRKGICDRVKRVIFEIPNRGVHYYYNDKENTLIIYVKRENGAVRLRVPAKKIK